jgi:predicted acetyltransferase
MHASIEAGATVGAFDDGRLVGSARYHAMEQWWHGRSMPMAAVGGVKVAPEERGRGIGTAMMAQLLADIASRGYPVSALYPATAPLYRSFGWEMAGGKYETVLPARSVAALIGPDGTLAAGSESSGGGRQAADPAIRRATPADCEAIVEVKGLVHGTLRHCGPSTREPWELRDWLDDPDNFAYLAPDGFLSYEWARQTDQVDVEELIAASAGTARALWRILASHATMATSVRACLAPDDPVHRLTREPDAELRSAETWMLRIVDAPAAVAARGFPTGVTVSVLLELTDPALRSNAGRWRLQVADGRGSLLRADDDQTTAPIRLGARGFAALFAGSAIGPLRLAGLVSGGNPGVDDTLESAFSCQPFSNDFW